MGDIDDPFWVRPFQIMEWSNEAALALIDEYRKHQVLWDARNQSYFSKSQKQEAWEAIAAAMQLDVHEVKQKMNSLLGSFRREKSKMKKNRDGLNGSGYCTKWFAFEKMQFLLREDESDITGIKFEEDEDSILEELKYHNKDPVEVGQSEKKAPTVAPVKRAKIVRKPSPDPILDDFSIFPVQDEYSAFGQYIACKLRKLDARSRAFVERAINNVLFEADIGKYDNLPSPLGTSQQNWGVNISDTNHISLNSPSLSDTATANSNNKPNFDHP